ncbi:MAG: DUF1415 domain-containing protein [Granulosicoccus sp.]|nr:DUF1415 domain-containing protein [Granulosicoccus sp.]
MALIGHWLDSMVIGLNLCPFAGSVRRRGLLRIVLASSDRTEQCLQELADEAHRLTVADEDATTLFVLPHGFADFDDYLDLLAVGEALLAELGYTGILQLASFHPRYQFDGTGIDELSNWTNRAPLPILHLLREDSVARAVEGHPDPQGIPGRNIQRLEELGLSGVKRLLCSKH